MVGLISCREVSWDGPPEALARRQGFEQGLIYANRGRLERIRESKGGLYNHHQKRWAKCCHIFWRRGLRAQVPSSMRVL
jgi:hypothetical protein